MKNFPKRDSNHIKETESWRVLRNKVPKHWIIREVSERDYGIDAYIEIVSTNGAVAGDMFFVQLKASTNIKWESGIAVLPKINKSTINYWLGLPAPVYIFWIELSTERMFFCPVKDTLRYKYKQFLSDKKSMAIPFNIFNEWGTEKGTVYFSFYHLREKEFNDYKNLLQTLAFNVKEYYEFIYAYQGRDFFLPVDEEVEEQMIELYKLCCAIASCYPIKWNVIDLHELYVEDNRRFDDGYDLHEISLTKVLSELEGMFLKIVNLSKDLITNQQEHYWANQHRVIYRKFKELDIEELQSNYYC